MRDLLLNSLEEIPCTLMLGKNHPFQGTEDCDKPGEAMAMGLYLLCLGGVLVTSSAPRANRCAG